MKKIFCLIVVSIVMISCSFYKPPKEYNFNRVKEINRSYDYVWEKLIDFLGEYNFPIKIMDKSSGYINTEGRISTKNLIDIFDCGAESGLKIGKSFYRSIAPTCNFNFLVRNKNDKVTLTINSFFDSSYLSYQYKYGIYCVSTGIFEKIIFDYIDGIEPDFNKKTKKIKEIEPDIDN